MIKIDKWSILAGLRFLSASIVAIQHLEDYAPAGWLGFVSKFGTFEAVLGFLLISGYSISISYAKQPDGFLWRRIVRLYPIYITAMAATYLAFYLLKVSSPAPLTLLVNFLFLNQLFTTVSFVGPAWSLSLEFWLYCMALGLMHLSNLHTRLIVFVSFICYLIYTVFRTTSHLPYYSGVGFGLNLILLSFIWTAGLRLARMGGQDKSALRDIGVIFACHIALAVIIQLGSRFRHHALADFFRYDALGYVMQSFTLISIFFIFKHLVITNRPLLHRSWFLRLLGDISYPLYLLHAAIYAMLAHFGLKMPILFYLTAVAISALVYWVIDLYSKRRHLQLEVS